MERAATTGWWAANTLLQRFGVKGHVLHTVPNQARSAVLRHLATQKRGIRR
jgi:isorenieratene synthase